MGDKTPKSRKSKPSSPAHPSRQEDRNANATRDDSRDDRLDPVEEASMDSFPASDPPSYEPLRAGDPDEEADTEKESDRDPPNKGGRRRHSS